VGVPERGATTMMTHHENKSDDELVEEIERARDELAAPRSSPNSRARRIVDTRDASTTLGRLRRLTTDHATAVTHVWRTPDRSRRWACG